MDTCKITHTSQNKGSRQKSHTADKFLKSFVHLLEKYAHRRIKIVGTP